MTFSDWPADGFSPHKRFKGVENKLAVHKQEEKHFSTAHGSLGNLYYLQNKQEQAAKQSVPCCPNIFLLIRLSLPL